MIAMMSPRLANRSRHAVSVPGNGNFLSFIESQVFPPHTDPGTIVPLGGGRSLVMQSSSLLSAIRARAPKSTVTFNDGRYASQAVALAKQSDVVSVFATQWTTENEDVPDLTLPHGQDELIEAVTQANPHTVVVLETGGPVGMPWLEHSAAVLEALTASRVARQTEAEAP